MAFRREKHFPRKGLGVGASTFGTIAFTRRELEPPQSGYMRAFLTGRRVPHRLSGSRWLHRVAGYYRPSGGASESKLASAKMISRTAGVVESLA